jgi:hypothetical protein
VLHFETLCATCLSQWATCGLRNTVCKDLNVGTLTQLNNLKSIFYSSVDTYGTEYQRSIPEKQQQQQQHISER